MLSHLYGRLSRLGRRRDGRLVLRTPVHGASLLDGGRGLLATNQALIAPTVFAVVQAGAIVTGHVLGLVVAQEHALHLVDRRHAVMGHLPVMVLMVLYTVGGLSLLFAD